MSCSATLVGSVVAWMRAAEYSQPADASSRGQGMSTSVLPTAVGPITASPAFPFDALSSSSAFAKSTILVVDLDSVVYDCVRVMLWCARERTERMPVPSLERLLCCFFAKLRDIVASSKMQVELVLGNCKDALEELNSSALAVAEGCDDDEVDGCERATRETHDQVEPSLRDAIACLTPKEATTRPSALGASLSASSAEQLRRAACADPSVAVVETSALWLQLYQVTVLYFQSSGSDVREWISFYCSSLPGWTAAVARVHFLSASPTVLNQQNFPLLWSGDARAFFATASYDAVVTPWLSFCRREMAQLCGRPLPAKLCLLRGDARLEDVWGAMADADLPGQVVVRHGPCTARRLGLRSAAYLPTLYALLALHDCRCVSLYPPTADRHPHWAFPASQAWCSCRSVAPGNSDASPAPSVDSRVTQAAALVNQYCGLLHMDLVRQWLAQVEGCGAAAPEDVAVQVWAAQNWWVEVSGAGVSAGRHVRPIWAGKEWRHHGPPPIPNSIAVGVVPLSPLNCNVDEAITPPMLLRRQRPCNVQVRLLPLRMRLLRIVHRLLDSGATSSNAGGSAEWDGAQRIDAALGRKVHLGSLLAEPLLDVAGIDTASPVCAAHVKNEVGRMLTEEKYRKEGCNFRAAADSTPTPTKPLAFQTRVSLDEVREDVRPAAQLTFVALSLLWRTRMFRMADCLRFFAFYLQYLDSERQARVNQTPNKEAAFNTCDINATASAKDAPPGAQEYRPDTSCIPSGVSVWEMAAWWHAVCCVTVLQSVSTSVPRAAQQAAPFFVATETLCDPASVFAGCLPSASYSAADFLSFWAFLGQSEALLPTDRVTNKSDADGSDDEENVYSSFQVSGRNEHAHVITAEELTDIRRALKLPLSLTHEFVSAYRIWTCLESALPQQQ